MTRHRRVARLAMVLLCAGAATGSGCQSYSQEQQDQDVLWSFRWWVADVWREHLAGKPTGPVDITVAQPEGGSLTVTGHTEDDGATHSLTYTFTSYRLVTTTGATMSFDSLSGTLVQEGSWEESITLTSEDLEGSGTLERDGYEPVPLEGPLELECTFESDSGVGSVNGRPAVSWDTGDDEGGGGGGDDDCALYTIPCGQVTDGVEVVGGIVPVRCGDCPPDTDNVGVDTVTAGGPYYLCSCR